MPQATTIKVDMTTLIKLKDAKIKYMAKKGLIRMSDNDFVVKLIKEVK